MKFKITLYLKTFFAFVVFSGILNASDRAKASDIKAALSHKLIEHITWVNENQLFVLKVGVLGADQELNDSLKKLFKGRSLKGVNVSVKNFKDPSDITGVDVLYVCQNMVEEIHQIYGRIANKNTLLITDNCTDYKYIMLNISETTSKEITFEVNKANLVIEGFQFSPKLLLLGGTEIDVRELYQKMREDLVLEKEKVLNQRTILNEMKDNIVNLGKEIQGLDKEISNQKKEINLKVKELSFLSENLDDKQTKLNQKDVELNEKTQQITMQANVIKKQQSDVYNGEENLKNLKKELANINYIIKEKQSVIDRSKGDIEKLRSEIKDQENQSNELSQVLSSKEKLIVEKESTISEQIKEINDQKTILLLTFLLLILAFALAISIMRANRTKHRLNIELEQKVVERTKDLEDSNEKLKVEIVEKQNAQMREKLHQEKAFEASKLASLGTLVAGVGHEINNPNEVIMLNAPLLKEVWKNALPLLDKMNEEEKLIFLNQAYEDVKHEIIHMFDDVAECSMRIKHIVKDLKDYAKPQSMDDYQLESVNSIIEVSIGLLKNTINKSTDHFEFIKDDHLPMMICQKQQIEQVMINLIQNSCQALSDKTQSIKIETKSIGDKIQITVEDQGCGISEENMKQLKDPFFTTKREFEGMGLGLAITSRIVENHKGELVYESVLGQGTKATLLFNVVEES